VWRSCCLLFDNDGVLVETEKWYFRANQEILYSMGIELHEERYMKIMVEGLSAFILAEEEGYDARRIDKAKQLRNELYQHYLQTENIEIPGAREIVLSLREKYEMGIVTSARREDFELIHKTRGIVECMKFVLCSGEYARSKPYPDPYLKGLENFGGTKSEALVIEDSQRGLRSALNAGIECVIVHNHFTRHHDFSDATYRIDSLEYLETLL